MVYQRFHKSFSMIHLPVRLCCLNDYFSDKACFECDSLSQTLMSVKNLRTINAQNITKNERNYFHYDAAHSVHIILQ